MLVIGQLLTAFLFAGFFEWISQRKKLSGATPALAPTVHHTLAQSFIFEEPPAGKLPSRPLMRHTLS